MKPYGCYNRPVFVHVTPVQDGWAKDGTRWMSERSFRMARDCQYTHTDLGKADARCDGCKHKVTE